MDARKVLGSVNQYLPYAVAAAAPVAFSMDLSAVGVRARLAAVDFLLWPACFLLILEHALDGREGFRRLKAPPVPLLVLFGVGALSVFGTMGRGGVLRGGEFLKELFQLFEYTVAGVFYFSNALARKEDRRLAILILLGVSSAILTTALLQYTVTKASAPALIALMVACAIAGAVFLVRAAKAGQKLPLPTLLVAGPVPVAVGGMLASVSASRLLSASVAASGVCVLLAATGLALAAARAKEKLHGLGILIAAADILAFSLLVFIFKAPAASGELARPDALYWVGGTFGNRNELGTFLALAVPVAAYLALAERDWRLRLWLGGFVLLSFALTTSASIVAVAAGVLAAGACAGRKELALSAGAVALGILLAGIMPRGNARELARSLGVYVREKGEYQVSARAKRWQASMDLLSGKPVFGCGLGNYPTEIKDHYGQGIGRPTGRTDDVAGFNLRRDEPGTYSTYLTFACEAGLLGLIALGWCYAYFLARAARAHGASFAALVGACVANLFGSTMVVGIGLVLAFVMALGLGEKEHVD